MEGERNEYSIKYILRSEVKIRIVFEDSSIDVKRILFLISSNEGDNDFRDSL